MMRLAATGVNALNVLTVGILFSMVLSFFMFSFLIANRTRICNGRRWWRWSLWPLRWRLGMELHDFIRHIFSRSAFPAKILQHAAPAVKWPGPKPPAPFSPEVLSAFTALVPLEKSKHREKAFVFRFVISFHSHLSNSSKSFPDFSARLRHCPKIKLCILGHT